MDHFSLRAVISTVGLLVFIFSCGELSRDDLLSGQFGTVDTSPPNLVAPLNHQTFDTGNITFAWTQNSFATEYMLELAEDENFTRLALDSPLRITSGSHTLNFSQAKSYYWRVKNNLSETYSAVRQVHLLDDNLYVYCPPERVTCGNEGRYGNLSYPYEVIARVIPIAKALDKPILVARRSNSDYYTETQTILLQDGVTLKGGYDPADWEQDLTQPTLVRTTATQGIALVGIRNPTLLEGFRIEAQGDFGLWVSDANQNTVVQHNTIVGRSGTGTSTGVYLEKSGLIIRNNVITAGTSFNTGYGLYAKNQTSALIYNNFIAGGAAASGSSFGYWTSGGNVVVAQNEIYGGQGTNTAAIYQNGPENNIYRILINTLYGGNATGNSTAVYFNIADQSLYSILTANLLAAGRGVDMFGFNIGNTPSGFMGDQNIYFHWSIATTNGYCHYSLNSPTFNRFFRNNDLKNCFGDSGSALYRGAATSYTEICNSGAFFGRLGCTETVAVTSSAGGTAGNRSETLADTFSQRPTHIRFTGDGPDAASVYNGGTDTIEFVTTADCNDFVTGEYFQYGNSNTARQITGKNCAASASMVTFSPPLMQPSVPGMPVLLWGTSSADYDRRFALKTTSANRNGGIVCVAANFEVLTHRWGQADSQAECDSLFPLGATYSGGFCVSQFLHPAVQIDEQGNPTGNLLCEANERCLYLQNSGSYQGHGTLIQACDVTAVVSGVQLFRFQGNGY